jgi:ABC-type multidrug transport system fused ATPase/permease subunit
MERLSFSYYDRVQTGQLVQRLTNDVEQIRSFAGSGVVQLANAVVMLVGPRPSSSTWTGGSRSWPSPWSRR